MSITAADVAQHRESTVSYTAPLLPPTPSDAEKTSAMVMAKSLSDDTSGVHDDDDIELPELHRVEPLNIPIFHEVLFIGVVIMAQFLTLAGLGQSIAPMAIIAETLSVSNNPGEQAWFAAAYSLTVGTFILISGQIGDILGHKRVFIFGFFFLGTWSAFAGFSAYTHRPIFFDICRGFQGIGAALLAPNALALLGRAYPPGIKKNIVFSLFGAMAPWGFVVGSLFASIFAQYAWWPWAFFSYGMAAWCLAAFALLVIPKSLAYEAQLGSGRQLAAAAKKKANFDYTGAVLGVVGLVLVNIAFNNGPLYGWGQAHVYLTLIFGLIALGIFFAVEIRAIAPILPVRALTSTVTYTMALVGIGWGSFGIWIYYSIRFLLEMRGESPLDVSIEYIPAMICGLLAAGVTGFMLTHTPVAFTMMMAMVAFFLGQLITATQPVHQTYWAQMFVAILIMPFGKYFPPPYLSSFLPLASPPPTQPLFSPTPTP
jgi:MFS family permease